MIQEQVHICINHDSENLDRTRKDMYDKCNTPTKQKD